VSKERGVSDDAPAIVAVAALAVDCTETGDGLAIDFLRVPEPKTVKNRPHLDLRSSDLAAATEQALAFGATSADDICAGGRWQVLRDPTAAAPWPPRGVASSLAYRCGIAML